MKNKYYNELNKMMLKEGLAKKENVAVSAYSLVKLLELLKDSTEQKTKEEIAHLIGQGVKNIRDDVFSSANLVAIDKCLYPTVKQSYLELIRKMGSEVFELEDNAKEKINAWVSEKTEKMIPELMKQELNNVAMCLVNAICFKDKWETPYEKADVYKEDFKNSNGSVSKVQMLHSKENYFVDTEYVKGFVKPYAHSDWAMMVLLPKKEGEDALYEAIEHTDIAQLEEQWQNVNVTFPEFTVETDLDLNETVKKMGIKEAFTANADFSPVTDENLILSSVMQKTKIEVTRAGTKAASASMGIAFAGCLPQKSEEIIVDRPFIYAIVHCETKLPVFTGVVNQI